MNLDEKTLCRYLYELAVQEPDKKLLGDASGWMTSSSLMKSAADIRDVLARLGVCPGNIVALHARRSIGTVAAIFGIRLLGGVACLTSPYREPEETLGECEAEISADCFVSEKTDGILQFRTADRCEQLCLNRTAPLSSEIRLPDDCCEPGFIIFTSGSTGKSKAVTLCDRNLAANLIDSKPVGCYSEDDIALGALPFEHVFGLVLTAGIAVLKYAMYIPDSTDVKKLLGDIEREKITRMNGVPALYRAMAESADMFDLSSMRAGFIGGAPVTSEQFSAFEKKLSMVLIPVYGMSECIGISCSDYREPAKARCGTVGRVYLMNTVRVLAEDGTELPPGEQGEIWVNGPARMLGYWPKRMDADAFLPTGDLGYLTEDGHLTLTGRKKDIIIRNGRNISPVRIESALLSLPGVTAAAVVGVPDEKQGEVPCAMVAGTAVPESLKELLPKNELPADILCVKALPMIASGKPDKQKIRSLLLARRANQQSSQNS